MHLKVRLLICNIVLTSAVIGQQFYASSGLKLFNRKEYSSASDSMVAWAQDHESEKGIAHYYAGECHYNLAFDQKDVHSAINHFDRARTYFEIALKQTDISTLYLEKKADAVYKLAWTCYRLAELDANPLKHLRNALQFFAQADSIADDSLKTASQFMMAETALRKAQLLRIQMLLSDNTGSAATISQEAIQSLELARNRLESIIRRGGTSGNWQLLAGWKRNDALFELGRLFETMSLAVFQRLNSPSGKKTPALTALSIYLNDVNYSSMLQPSNAILLDRFKTEIDYSETIRRLHIFLLSGLEKDRQFLNNKLDSLGSSVSTAEKAMIQGVRDLKFDIQDEAFIQLADPKSGFFSKASSDFQEALFWMGIAQYLSGDPQCISTLDRFLHGTDRQFYNPFNYLLKDQATYISFRIRFDHNINKRDALFQMKKELELFKPAEASVKENADLLLKLVRLSLGETVWGKILDASTQEDRFRDAFVLIQDALVRATRVIGVERVPYLKLLDELFKITQYKRPEETAFYRGMALFLKAEIQETAAKKREWYQSAASAMQSIDGKFASEARYIEARSIFAGAKHGSRSLDDYNKARPIFIELINNAGSLRSLFYLGEILRVQDNDRAARECYRIVMEKTKDQQEGEFWFQNAKAGYGLCSNGGDVSVLRTVKAEYVQYPEILLTNDEGEAISLERFADFDYIRRLIHNQTMDLFLKFGLPKRNLYPSESRIGASRFAARDFYPHHAGIREKLGTIASGLRLTVLLPQYVTDDAVITFDGTILLRDDNGFYQKSPIPLNESAEIRILHKDCYPFIQSHVFSQPGIEHVVVSLIRKEKYIETSRDALKRNAIQFLKRNDRNVVFLTGSVSMVPPSSMMMEFENDVGLRDFAFSETLDGFIAVHAKKGNAILFRNGSKSEFVLNYPKNQPKLKSAEGIAVDSHGSLYIVDWETHVIFVFDSRGNFIRTIGSFGKNAPNDIGKSVRFEFPMRIAIAEDLEGVSVGSKRVFYPMTFFVTDRNGIQYIDVNGMYLGTILTSFFEQGSLSAVSIDGINLDRRIQVYNRRTNSIIQFATEPIRSKP